MHSSKNIFILSGEVLHYLIFCPDITWQIIFLWWYKSTRSQYNTGLEEKNIWYWGKIFPLYSCQYCNIFCWIPLDLQNLNRQRQFGKTYVLNYNSNIKTEVLNANIRILLWNRNNLNILIFSQFSTSSNHLCIKLQWFYW